MRVRRISDPVERTVGNLDSERGWHAVELVSRDLIHVSEARFRVGVRATVELLRGGGGFHRDTGDHRRARKRFRA